jgi:hypothetical protein
LHGLVLYTGNVGLPGAHIPQVTDEDIDLEAIISDISELLDNARRHHSQQAEEAGYALDLFRGLGPVVQRLDLEQRQSLAPTFEKFRLFLKAKEQAQGTLNVSSAAFSVSGTATGNVAIAFPVVLNTYLPQPFHWSPERSERYANRLKKIDPEVGRLYRSAAQVFWGSTENPERSALYQLRECFEQLFVRLAPDEEVRKSEFFQEKPAPDEMQVHRRERILYAARARVKDRAQGEFLAEHAGALLLLHKKLQRAHERAPLDRDQTRLAIESMIVSLEQWVDAVDPV